MGGIIVGFVAGVVLRNLWCEGQRIRREHLLAEWRKEYYKPVAEEYVSE